MLFVYISRTGNLADVCMRNGVQRVLVITDFSQDSASRLKTSITALVSVRCVSLFQARTESHIILLDVLFAVVGLFLLLLFPICGTLAFPKRGLVSLHSSRQESIDVSLHVWYKLA